MNEEEQFEPSPPDVFTQSVDWDFNPSASPGSQDRYDDLIVALPSRGENSLSDIPFILATIWKSRTLREDLCNLKGDDAQLIINYLYSVQFTSVLPEPWLHRHCIIALYKLSAASELYPHCYKLKESISPKTQQPLNCRSADIYTGEFDNKVLCFKVIRVYGTDLKKVLKIYTKEAILWGQLHHPNIAPFYGIYYLNQELEQICLVSPWMQHGNLVQYLRNMPSAPRELLAYDVASGLSYLHERGLIHSDLKGANILVNDIGQACITDFGTSFIHTDKTLSQTIGMTGYGFTPRWAAPELSDENVRSTMESDIWALGCVFWEILTRKLPYDGLNDFQIIRAQINKKPPGKPTAHISSSILWKEAEPCWTIEPAGRPKCQDIVVSLRQAGISRGDNDELRRDAEQEMRKVRNALRISLEGSVNREAVKNVLADLCKGHI